MVIRVAARTLRERLLRDPQLDLNKSIMHGKADEEALENVGNLCLLILL